MQTRLLVVCSLGGCFQSPSLGPSDGGADSHDGPPPTCTMDQVSCAGDTLVTCVAGQPELDVTCGWGCSIVGAPHCLKLQPAGGGAQSMDLDPDAQLQPTTLDNVTVNSADGSITGLRGHNITGVFDGIGWAVHANIAVFRFGKLTITGPVFLVGSKPIVFASLQTIDVNDDVDAQGQC